jgi:hypothetical protein
MEGFVTHQFLAKALVSKESSEVFFWLHPTFLVSPYKVYLGDP